MQKKTINKIINDKMSIWLNSLPVKLAEEVRPNILVSGGSIASMFLKEPINDYDIYIQDVDVLKELVKYYTTPLSIKIYDGRDRDELLKEKAEDSQYKFENDNSLFGIFLRNLNPGQIKLDVGSTGRRFTYPKTEKKLNENIFFPLFMSENAITLTNDIQIVTRFTGNHKEIHKTFDFIHATNYWTFDTGLVTNIKAVESLLTKQLYYQGSLYPLTSVIRIKKFISRGWKISAGEILKMLFQTADLNLKNPAILQEQLIGVDIAYFGKLIEIIQDISKEKLDYSRLSKEIDKVFNNIDIENNEDNI